jgi:hypothetical protein
VQDVDELIESRDRAVDSLLLLSDGLYDAAIGRALAKANPRYDNLEPLSVLRVSRELPSAAQRPNSAAKRGGPRLGLYADVGVTRESGTMSAQRSRQRCGRWRPIGVYPANSKELKQLSTA